MLFNSSKHPEDIISSKNAVSTSKTEHSSSVASRPSIKSSLSEWMRYLDICRISIIFGDRFERRCESVSLLDEKSRSLGTAEA